MRQLLAAAETTNLFVPTLIWLATGLRRGELLGLEWRDLEREQYRLAIVRSLEETRAGLVLKAPKTTLSSRVITLPILVVDALHVHEVQMKALRLRRGPALVDQGLIFPRRNGGPQRPRAVTKAFTALIRRAKVANVSIHRLRHTHVTNLLRAGLHPKVVLERAGHASVAFTLQRYARATRHAARCGRPDAKTCRAPCKALTRPAACGANWVPICIFSTAALI